MNDVVWQSLAWPSTVVHRLRMTPEGLIGHGFAAGKTDQSRPFAYKYIVTLTKEWQLKAVIIGNLLSEEQMISLQCEADKWHDSLSNTYLPTFDDIPFIDIAFSPFTNSLPIKRLNFTGNKPKTIKTIYFDENSFSLRVVQQIYTRIDAKTYTYQDVETPDFTANLTIDEDGLVVDYEGLFKRI